jgi:hypothetical protein
MVSALERLVDRHGGGNYADYIVKLTFPRNPNGVYLIKGGGPKVWRVFGLPRNWRKLQGIIHGQRGGVTENLGAAAVKRWKKSQQPELPDDSSQHASGVGFAQNLLKE